MGFRSLDVGTSRTPLIGQPSLSGNYLDDHLVNHLGAVHFYAMAPFVRLVGIPTGMLLVSVLITGTCLVLTAWAVFRQLGAGPAALAAVVLAAVTFTTGASSLVNPVSSNIAGYPFLCSIFLLWCLLCGDLRLLPLTVGMVSFTALQHLSVLPSLAIATVLATAGGVLRLTVGTPPEERPSRGALLRWGGITAGVAAVLWLPLAFQQLFGDRPNITALYDFTRSSDRPSLGYATGLRHVVHVLGLPPLLGQMDIRGEWLFATPAFGTWITAAAMVAIVGFAAWFWRSSQPRRSALAVMVLIVAFAGFLGSANVPAGNEQYRMVFYHWTFALAALAALVVGLLVGELVGPLARRANAFQTTRQQPILLAVALVATAVPIAVNPSLDRWTNTLQAAYPPFERDVLEDLGEQVMASEDRLGGDVVLVGRGGAFFAGLDSALALDLEGRGLSVKLARYHGVFVDGERQTTQEDVDLGLVLVLDTDVPFEGYPDPPEEGEMIAELEVPGGVVLWAHYDHDVSQPEPATLEVYLLERDELLDWVKRRELASRDDRGGVPDQPPVPGNES